MDFIPLSIWAVGFLIYVEYTTIHMHEEGKSIEKKMEYGDTSAKIWWCGCVFFFLIGLFS